MKEAWVVIGTENVLWLPPEYRPSFLDVHGNVVALDLELGSVLILEFVVEEYLDLVSKRSTG